jgi:hypothetical protein
MTTSTHDTVKHVIDGVSIMTTVGAVMNWLPAIAALLSIIWTALRIVEIIFGREFSVLIGTKKEDKKDALNQ